MNEPNDELHQLWSAPVPAPPLDPARVLAGIERKSNQFRRTIRLRDWRETAAAALVAAFFLWIAFRDHDPLSRAAELWITLSALWISFYLHRQSRTRNVPPRTHSLNAYADALLDSYTRQITLLKTVKYWYLAPMWLGLVALNLARWRLNHNTPSCLAAIAVYTALFVFLAWLNESPGVRSLEAKRAELAALLHNLETSPT